MPPPPPPLTPSTPTASSYRKGCSTEYLRSGNRFSSHRVERAALVRKSILNRCVASANPSTHPSIQPSIHPLPDGSHMPFFCVSNMKIIMFTLRRYFFPPSNGFFFKNIIILSVFFLYQRVELVSCRGAIFRIGTSCF